METENKENTYSPDITKEDLMALGEKTKNLRNDSSDDMLLQERDRKVDFEGKDLDVPGRTLESNKKTTSLRDEENQLYAQGSGHNDALEQSTNG